MLRKFRVNPIKIKILILDNVFELSLLRVGIYTVTPYLILVAIRGLLFSTSILDIATVLKILSLIESNYNLLRSSYYRYFHSNSQF